MMLDLEEIEKRAEAATSGPWDLCRDDAFGVNDGRWRIVDRQSIDRFRELGTSANPPYLAVTIPPLAPSPHDLEQCAANSRFIATARQDVPALVAEVRKLREIMAKALSAPTIVPGPTGTECVGCGAPRWANHSPVCAEHCWVQAAREVLRP